MSARHWFMVGRPANGWQKYQCPSAMCRWRRRSSQLLRGSSEKIAALPGIHGPARQFPALAHARQQMGDQRGLAGLPLAGQECDLAGAHVAMPRPRRRRGDSRGQFVAARSQLQDVRGGPHAGPLTGLLHLVALGISLRVGIGIHG
jgi:hypothetical protein